MKEEARRLSDDLSVYRETGRKVEEVLAREKMFYRTGKVSLNQVLETERLLISQRQNEVTSLYRLIRARIERRYIEGKEINDQDFE